MNGDNINIFTLSFNINLLYIVCNFNNNYLKSHHFLFSQ